MDESAITKRRSDLNDFIDCEMKKVEWIKIVCIGESQAGKTCLIKSLCENRFDKVYQETIGVDYGFKLYKNGLNDVRLTFWDLAGHQSYFKVRRELYSQTDICLLIYDATTIPPISNFAQWKHELDSYGGKISKLVVVGNKIDLSHKKSLINDIAVWAEENTTGHYVTSAATGDGIDDMFKDILDKFYSVR